MGRRDVALMVVALMVAVMLSITGMRVGTMTVAAANAFIWYGFGTHV